MELTVSSVSYQGGTVAVLTGVDNLGLHWRFGADHRPARDIAAALEAGEEVVVNVEPWQILGGQTHGEIRVGAWSGKVAPWRAAVSVAGKTVIRTGFHKTREAAIATARERALKVGIVASIAKQ